MHHEYKYCNWNDNRNTDKKTTLSTFSWNKQQTQNDWRRYGNAEIISKGEASKWTSPGFLINQKAGERFIVDYRDVNSNTKKFHYPLPDITTILDKTHGSRIFSVMDAKKGYFQCNIDEMSRDKTGFVTPFGIYKLNSISFGLSNTPA